MALGTILKMVVLDISMSLDGFIAGLHDRPDNPLGDNGMLLHRWIWGSKTDGRPGNGNTGRNRTIFEGLIHTTGAMVVGHRTYSIVHGWGGSHPIHGMPVFVMCGEIPEDVPKGTTKFTFVTSGVKAAIQQARAAAGEKNVYVIGGANVAQQCLKAGLLDELQIHVAPVLLGGGIRLFDHLGTEPIKLINIRIDDAPETTHFRFRFAKLERSE